GRVRPHPPAGPAGAGAGTGRPGRPAGPGGDRVRGGRGGPAGPPGVRRPAVPGRGVRRGRRRRGGFLDRPGSRNRGVPRPAARRAVAGLFAELAGRHAGCRVEVATNAALPPLEDAGGLPVVPFAPPAELGTLTGAARHAAVDLYYADWLLARRPDAVVIPG